MGVEKETINLIALKKVYDACKPPQSLLILSCPGWVIDGCLLRKAQGWDEGRPRDALVTSWAGQQASQACCARVINHCHQNQSAL